METCERRRTNRYVIRIPLNFEEVPSAKSTTKFGEINNLSPQGVCFSTKVVLAVGATVGIFLKVPEDVIGKPSPEWHWIGEVVYVMSDGAPDYGYCVGVRFIEYEPC
jgi:PilZ domain